MALNQLKSEVYSKKYKPGYNNYVKESTSIEIIDHTFEYKGQNKWYSKISRYGDVIKFNSLVLCTNSNAMDSIELDSNNFKNDDITIIIGGKHVMTYNINLMMELYPVKKIGNSLVLKIPNECTFGEILYIALQYDDVHVCVMLQDSQIISSVQLYVEHKYYEHDIRKSINENLHEKPIQYIRMSASHTWNCNVETIITTKLIGLMYTKGHFIEGNLSKIKKMVIYINGSPRISYDNIMLQAVCFKISNNLHYFSYTNENNYNDISFKSFDGSPNFNNYDQIKLKLYLYPSNESESTIKFYSVTLGIMRYFSGMANILYNNTDENNIVSNFVEEQNELIIFHGGTGTTPPSALTILNLMAGMPGLTYSTSVDDTSVDENNKINQINQTNQTYELNQIDESDNIFLPLTIVI